MPVDTECPEQRSSPDMREKPGHIKIFSTDMLPERERFDIFHDRAAKSWMRVDVQLHEDEPFFSHNRLVDLGAITCLEFTSSPGSYGRSRELLKDGNDNIVLVANSDLPVHHTSQDSVIASGDAVLIDCAQKGYVRPVTSGAMRMVSIPRKTLTRLAPGIEDFACRSVVKDRVELTLLRTYIQSILQAPTTIASTTLDVAGQHIVDLVALLLGAAGDAAHQAKETGLRAARLLAMTQSISQRLHNPSLSLTEIARSNGISERNVQRLFEDIDTSFSNYLLEQRLELANRLLSNPLHRHRRISDIAAESGFGDLSHFNRSFRRRFGDTPSTARSRLRG